MRRSFQTCESVHFGLGRAIRVGIPNATKHGIHMRRELDFIRLGEMHLNLESECPDLEHVETFNVSAEAQASVDREYIKFLEAKNAYLKDLCVRAWLSLAAMSLNRAQRLLASADAVPFALYSTSQAHRKDS